jgi:hypothetical protein
MSLKSPYRAMHAKCAQSPPYFAVVDHVIRAQIFTHALVSGRDAVTDDDQSSLFGKLNADRPDTAARQ